MDHGCRVSGRERGGSYVSEMFKYSAKQQKCDVVYYLYFLKIIDRPRMPIYWYQFFFVGRTRITFTSGQYGWRVKMNGRKGKQLDTPQFWKKIYASDVTSHFHQCSVLFIASATMHWCNYVQHHGMSASYCRVYCIISPLSVYMPFLVDKIQYPRVDCIKQKDTSYSVHCRLSLWLPCTDSAPAIEHQHGIEHRRC